MTETEARAEIVEFGRRVWQRRLTSGSSGNISVRLGDGNLIVTPAGKSLERLTPGDLMCVDAEGNVRDRGTPTSELPLHLAAYRVRPDIRCVVHTHPTFSVVWSRTGSIFPRDTVGAMESLAACAWTPYRKNGTEELAAVCAEEFAKGADVVVMERHGVSAVATSLEEAFVQTDSCEEAARIAYFSAIMA